MSDRGQQFADDWVSENLHAGPYLEEDDPRVEATVVQFLADAREAGVTRAEIEEDVGDLHDFIANAFESVTDDEVKRLADKDD